MKKQLQPLANFSLALLMGCCAANVNAVVGNPRVNQLGYLPVGAKFATYVGSSGNQAWQLKQNGTTVASGTTSAATLDAATGQYLQQIDLSSVTNTGTGFALTVGADTSYNFKISSDVFSPALYDSLRYFYHNRAGIAIATSYTGGGNGSYATDAKWSRPAGHIGVSPNLGDYNVGCWAGMSCGYTLSPIKGWYDAGDHGKYVVNGGISVWTLLNMYERNQHLIPISTNLQDGKLNIPESTNGIPDILDEARWEVEFMLAMQVPVGQTKAGMVHHKLHDVGWTGFPLSPSADPKSRAVVMPTTAATLNTAAVAAQCARIWANIDSAFSASCLTAATRAWDAAVANPAVYYDANLYGTNMDNGGGGYGDSNVTDEFYWAAAELYITTGDSKYLPTINNRTLVSSAFSWADTEVLGTMSLATVTASHTTSLRASAKQRVGTLADTHLATQANSGYSTPLLPTTAGYDWGSNSEVMNKMILMGLAYDFTLDNKYAVGVTKGLDYLLGRNYFSTSFVTYEGTNTMIQPHHRFWANAGTSSSPIPPPGAISGGPNAASLVGTAEGAPAGCATYPATCWRDNWGAYGVNEITVNWNSPLAWILNFAKDYGDGTAHGPAVPNALPFTIQAEAYASMVGVQTETTTDTGGGLNVGWTDAGDKMVYSNLGVVIPSTGNYTITYRVASGGTSGGSLALREAGSSTAIDTVTLPLTGGWQTWQTVTRTTSLTAGTHYFEIGVVTAGFNINWFKIEATSAASSVAASSTPASSTPASSIPASSTPASSIPASSTPASSTPASSTPASSTPAAGPLVTIQAENYAAMLGVQLETTTDTGGGQNVGYIDINDWMSYTNVPVTIPTTGTYTIEYRVASGIAGGGALSFEEAGGGTVYGTKSIAATGGWQTWVTVKHTVTLSAGVHNFGIKATAGGWNFNWFRITPGAI